MAKKASKKNLKSHIAKEGVFLFKNSKGYGFREFLEECLSYNPYTGVLTWRTRPQSHFKAERWMNLWNARYAGKIAGCDRGDGMTVAINHRQHKAHRICWILAGNAPIGEMLIDHINGNPIDNRLTNLRLANSSQNNANSKVRSHNKCGLKGVYYHRKAGKWAAHIRFGGRSEWLGLHLTKGLAALERAKAAIRVHGTFARIN